MKKTKIIGRQFYVGDIVFNKTQRNSTFGQDLIGITSACLLQDFVLFHRPFRNRIKHLRNKMFGNLPINTR